MERYILLFPTAIKRFRVPNWILVTASQGELDAEIAERMTEPGPWTIRATAARGGLLVLNYDGYVAATAWQLVRPRRTLRIVITGTEIHSLVDEFSAPFGTR